MTILFIFCISGCKQRGDTNMESEFWGNIPINNTIDIKSVKRPEYSLSELNNYFGEYSLQEKSVFNIENYQVELDIQTVNTKFPIEFIRNNGNFYYSLYKVKEGGFYYVFWSISDDNIYVSDTFYIDKLKNISDFKSLTTSTSTYEDVYSLDPSSELILILSNGIYSYSLLDTGELLQIEYKFTDMKQRKDLIVKNMTIISTKYPSFLKLKSIFNMDIP